MSLEDLRRTVKNNDRDYNYFVMNNLKVDLRDLISVKKLVIDDIVSDSYKYVEQDSIIQHLEYRIEKYCKYLSSKGIPFDGVSIVSPTGLIITKSKYEEMLKSYMEGNRKQEEIYHKRGYSTGLKDTLISWHYSNSIGLIKNLEISDTLKAIPLDFKFVPRYTEGSKQLSSFGYLGQCDSYSDGYKPIIVYFDELVEELDTAGYKLRFNNDIIDNYEDYFKAVVDFSGIKKSNYSQDSDFFDLSYKQEANKKQLLIDVDFRDDNNIRLGG